MKNYFENAPVNWNNWNPSNVIFKSNMTTKKLLPSDNVMSWKSKGDRDLKLAKRTGGKLIQNQYSNHYGVQHYSKANSVGVMVELKELKSDFPSANIDFLDYREKTNSVGDLLPKLDALVYVQSFHNRWQWQQVNGNWQKIYGKATAPLDEGYVMSYGGQGDSNPMKFETFQELLQISEAVKNFLVECVVPAKNGEFDYDQLLVA